MSFSARLLEAKEEAEDERTETKWECKQESKEEQQESKEQEEESKEQERRTSLVRQAAAWLEELDDDEGFAELKEFEDQCLAAFAEDEGRSGDDYKIEYYDMHRRFCEIFEQKFEGFLVEHQCSAE